MSVPNHQIDPATGWCPECCTEQYGLNQWEEWHEWFPDDERLCKRHLREARDDDELHAGRLLV